MTNSNYGKLTDGVLTYAPKNIRIDGTIYGEPTAEQYAAQGWLQIHSTPPTDKVGVNYIPEGWEARDGAIFRVWREEAVVAPTPVYKVEDIIYGLITRNALVAAKGVVGDYWELFTMREVIAADNEIWAARIGEITAAIVATGALTAEDIADILKDAEV